MNPAILVLYDRNDDAHVQVISYRGRVLKFSGITIPFPSVPLHQKFDIRAPSPTMLVARTRTGEETAWNLEECIHNSSPRVVSEFYNSLVQHVNEAAMLRFVKEGNASRTFPVIRDHFFQNDSFYEVEGDEGNLFVAQRDGVYQLREGVWFRSGIIMDELGGNDLSTLIHKSITGPSYETLPLWRSLYVLAEICFAIRYLHKNSIVHNDVKAKNVRVEENARFPYATKVTMLDLGTCERVEGQPIGGMEHIAPLLELDVVKKRFFVTSQYMTPRQVLRGSSFDLEQHSQYLGAVLKQSPYGTIQELETGRTDVSSPIVRKAIDAYQLVHTVREVLSGELDRDLVGPSELGEHMVNLLLRKDVGDPEYTIGKIKRAHPQLKGFEPHIQNLMSLDPYKQVEAIGEFEAYCRTQTDFFLRR